jgi:hypothetical protein
MHHEVTSLVQDAHVPAAGVPIEATIKRVRLGVEAPEVSSAYGG